MYIINIINYSNVNKDYIIVFVIYFLKILINKECIIYMVSYILGEIELDNELLKRDLEIHESFPKIPEEYDEFSSGFWMNCTLWGSSEDETDTQYKDYNHSIVKTTYGKKLDYISRLVEENFNTENLKMVRTRNLIDALIMPHRDFIDLKKGISSYFRVFIPLETNLSAFHSDVDNVFCMQKGEVWFLDAGIVHAAANFSNKNRMFLCLDFAFDGEFHPKEIFKNESLYNKNISPNIIEREKVDNHFEEELINSLSKVIHRNNFKEIVFILSKVHFYKDVPIESCYDWLLKIAEINGDKKIIDKSVKVKEFLIDNRNMGERFSFADWN